MSINARRVTASLAVFFILLGTPGLVMADEVEAVPSSDVQPAPVEQPSTTQDQPLVSSDAQQSDAPVEPEQEAGPSPVTDVTPAAEPAPDATPDEDATPPDSMSEMNSMMGNEPSAGQQTSTTIKTTLPQADDASGALLYSYPIKVPPGRNGMQPDLSLTYSSQSNGLIGWFGHGWDITIPSIERLKKKGIGTLFTDGNFTSSMSGELVSSASGVYEAKVDGGDFLKYGYVQTPATNAVQMDVAVGLADQASDPYVLPVTVANNSNRYLLCSFTTYPNAQSVTAVTFNGAAMTELATHTSDGHDRTYLYGLVNPPTGTHDFSVTQTYGYGASGGCAVYFNVDQTTPIGTVTSNTGSGSNPAVTAYVGTGGILATALGRGDVGGTATLAGTLGYDSGDQNGFRNLQGYVVTSGTTTATWTNAGGGGGWGVFGVPINLAAGGTSDEVNTWTVKDKRGMTYVFGSTSSSRMTDAVDTTKAFKWMLSKVTDTNGNYVRYEYFKDGGQIYPSKIFYTGNGTSDGLFEVDFTRESRPDHPKQYYAGIAVASNYRISEIDVKTSGSWTRKYVMAYGSGDDSHTSRSILSTVVESGQDELTSATTTLPAQSFGYQKLAYSGSTWSSDTSYDWPNIVNCDGTYGPLVISSSNNPQGVRTADVNGDGLPDLLYSIKDWAGRSCSAVYIHKSNGNGWAYDSSWSVPVPFVDTSSAKDYWGAQLADVNGDSLVDIVYGCEGCGGTWGTYQGGVYVNSATGWSLDTNYVWPENYTASNHNPGTYLIFTDHSGFGQGVQAADVNGDGLVDLIKYKDVSGGSPDVMAWINKGDGTGWSRNTTWLPPKSLGDSSYGSDMGVRLSDLNNDGLVDMVYSRVISYPFDTGVYVNNGNGWAFDSGYVLPTDAQLNNGTPLGFVSSSGFDMGTRIIDANGDGYPDLVMSKPGGSWAYINNTDGTGWTYKNTIGAPDYFTDGSGNNSWGVSFADVNGDGLDDIVQASYYSGSTTHHVYVNGGQSADALSSVTYPHGGVTSITYKPTTQYVDGSSNRVNTSLPFPLQAVSKISNDDGFGTVSTVTRSYAGGKNWYNTPFDHKFAGFATITDTDAATSTTTTFYHQGDSTDSSHGEYDDHVSKIGRPYRVETRDVSGNLYGLTVNQWDRSDLGSDASFVKLARSTGLDYDGNGSHKDRASEYAYDGYGNATAKTEWGEVTGSDDGSFSDVGSDKLTAALAYASSTDTAAYVVGVPQSESVSGQIAGKVRESRYYYDGLSLGSVNQGNLTKKEDWVSGSTYVNAQKAYDGTYGLVTSDTDPRGKVTAYAYDAYNLYPATVTNPLSHVSQYAYDYSLGKPKQVIDPNLLMTQTTFDGLDRVLAEKQPDQSTTSTMVTRAEYAYADTALAASLKKTSWLNSATGTDAWTYLDGFDRPIQVRTHAEATNTYATSDIAYNTIGTTLKESLPYFSIGTARTSSSTSTSLYTTHAYDPLRRPSSDVNAVGTTSYAYDDWKTTVTDALSNAKGLYRDAFGRLNRVDEVFNATNTFATLYAYDGNGNLTSATDSLANVRHFTYDGLGHRLAAQDLHATGDGSYGTWSYAYDDAGNLTSSVDPKSQTVNYAYDDLSRPTSEDYASASGTEVTYTYDTCQYGKGRLCTSASASATSTMLYGPTGQATRVTKTISGTGYQTDTTYDRQGNAVATTQPDSSQVQNLYNNGGLLEKVQRKESTDGSWADVVSNFDWSPVSKPTVIAYANGATTTNTYDATQLYRLTHRQTVLPSLAVAQDAYYAYDADGNVTDLYDAAPTAAQKGAAYTYDSLNRLVAAEAMYDGTNPDGPSRPDTAIFSGPTDPTWSATATLAFGSPDATATFECKLDSGSWSACSSPKAYSGLTPVAHAFSVRATNAIGTDLTPATLSWTVASVPARAVALSSSGNCEYGSGSGKCGTTNVETLPLTVAATNPYLIANFFEYSYWCPGTVTATYNSATMTLATNISFSGNNWLQFELANPDQGTHNLVVTQPSACGYTLLAAVFGGVDQVTPHGTIGTGSGATGNQPTASATGTAGGLVYSALHASNNPDATPNSPLVMAVDARSAYLPGASAITSATGTVATNWTLVQNCCAYWALDATPLASDGLPDTGITSGPTSSTWSATSTLEFVSSDTAATFECKLDAGSYGSCSSPQTYVSATGTHTFYVRAVNSVGTDPTPTSRSWIVTSPPALGASATANYTERYAYDAVGNLLTKSTQSGTATPATTTYAYAGTNYANPHAATTVGSATYAYDNDGNLSTRASDVFAWDYRNRLLSAIVNGATTTYAYDPNGDRVQMTAGASSTAYASDGYSVSGGRPTKHIFVNGILVATVEGTTSTATVHYVATDHLTGANVVMSSTGTVEEATDYNPYGDIRIDSKSTPYSEVRKFAGHEYDAADGLQYFGARYYDGSLGRFLSEDPLFLSVGDQKQVQKTYPHGQEALLSDPQALNSYAYARNNPLLYRDPDGKMFGIDDAIGFVVGGLVGTTAQVGGSLIMTGHLPSGSQVSGAFVTGGIIGWGAINTPETLGASNAVSAAILTGMLGGFYGDLTKQGIDIATGKQTGGLNATELSTSSLVGAGTNGILQGALPDAQIPGLSSGRGNMNAVGDAMRTKATSGIISNMSANTAVKSAVGSQAADAFRTVVGGMIDSIQSYLTKSKKK